MFRGVIPALVTPMKADGAIDYPCLERLVEFHVENRSDALLPCGTTGESPTLSHDEHLKVVECVVKTAGDRIPVIAGTGSNNTAEAIAFTVEAQRIGASGALLITPYYNKPTQEGLYLHYKAVAGRVDIPLIVYNCPGRTSLNLEPETLARLADLPNIVAVKEASGSLEQVNRIMNLCDIVVLSGDDSLTYPMLALGGKGVISVAANLVPGRIGEMIRLYTENQAPQGLALHRTLYPLMRGLFVETNPIPVKAAMHMVGLIPEGIRPPLTPLSPEHRAGLTALLKELKLL